MGSSTVVSRIVDVLFVHAIRHHDASVAGGGGWLGVLPEPGLGFALQAIHRDPARRWTVEGLSRVADMPRSTFAARFKSTIGEAPLRYVTRWRMILAAELLRERNQRLVDIAMATGYESDAALCRAFKRWTGLTPSMYRRDLVDGARASA